jgi:hypothetical protein
VIKMDGNNTRIGAVNAEQVVIGNGNILVKKVYGNSDPNSKKWEEINLKLDELIKQIKANKDLLDNPDELVDSVSNVEAELKKVRPNKTTIKGTLNELASQVSSITTLANAVSALKVAVIALFG